MGAPNETLGIVGVGRLASFVVEGLRRSGDERPIVLSPRGAGTAAELAARYGCRVARDNQSVIDGAGTVMVAVPPRDVLGCVAGLKWRIGQRLVCVAIDVSRAALEKAAPGATVLRAMPSAAAALGICPTPLYPADRTVRALLSGLGPVFEVDDERAFDAATALAAYHLWCFGLMQAMAEAATDEGLTPDAAAGMVAGLTRAAAEFALRLPAGASLRQPLDENGVPGTMTAQGLAVLEQKGGFKAWRQGYARAIARLRPGAGLTPD